MTNQRCCPVSSSRCGLNIRTVLMDSPTIEFSLDHLVRLRAVSIPGIELSYDQPTRVTHRDYGSLTRIRSSVRMLTQKDREQGKEQEGVKNVKIAETGLRHKLRLKLQMTTNIEKVDFLPKYGAMRCSMNWSAEPLHALTNSFPWQAYPSPLRSDLCPERRTSFTS